jgi:predicted RNase H-like nuclease (RuvC/YqgF family)
MPFLCAVRLLPMAVSGYRHTDNDKRSRQELLEEIARLKEKLKAKDEEIGLLKKRLALYKTLK